MVDIFYATQKKKKYKILQHLFFNINRLAKKRGYHEKLDIDIQDDKQKITLNKKNCMHVYLLF